MARGARHPPKKIPGYFIHDPKETIETGAGLRSPIVWAGNRTIESDGEKYQFVAKYFAYFYDNKLPDPKLPNHRVQRATAPEAHFPFYENHQEILPR